MGLRGASRARYRYRFGSGFAARQAAVPAQATVSMGWLSSAEWSDPTGTSARAEGDACKVPSRPRQIASVAAKQDFFKKVTPGSMWVDG